MVGMALQGFTKQAGRRSADRELTPFAAESPLPFAAGGREGGTWFHLAQKWGHNPCGKGLSRGLLRVYGSVIKRFR